MMGSGQVVKKMRISAEKPYKLIGGFLAFQAMHPALCESKSSNNNYKTTLLTSLSQPCMPISNVGPTRILPFLYLGSEKDVLSQETLQVNGISYVLNVSMTCAKPGFIQDSHFLRIPVNDNYSEKMIPYFEDAFQYLDKVREVNGCVIIHCLAGISRSATLAIAYVMRYLHLSSDDAYRYVKEKRPTISPNFNFLGQLLDYEKRLKSEMELKKSQPMYLGDHGKHGMKTTPGDLCSPSSPMINKPNKTFFIDHKSTNCENSSDGSRCVCDKTPQMIVTAKCDATSNVVMRRRKHVRTDVMSSSTSSSAISSISEETSSTTVIHRAGMSPCTPPRTSGPRPRPFSFSGFLTSNSPTQSVHSPTTALAKLSFGQSSPSTPTPPGTSEGKVTKMDTDFQLYQFPTTSLDQLSFVPCLAKDNRVKSSGGTKRPISSVTMSDPSSSTDTLSSPTGSCNDCAPCVTSQTSTPTKVVLRSHDNKAKRPLVRPNSIAFSTYPTFDLGSDCQNSPCSSSSTSQDDSAESFIRKRSKPSVIDQTSSPPKSHYTEKHLYKKITAAMETAMIKTQVLNADSSRKSRSLDDILNEEESMEASYDCKIYNKLPRRSHGSPADLYKSPLYETLQFRCRGTSDPYQSNSSISSSGSHSSLHGSLEIIQVS